MDPKPLLGLLLSLLCAAVESTSWSCLGCQRMEFTQMDQERGKILVTLCEPCIQTLLDDSILSPLPFSPFSPPLLYFPALCLSSNPPALSMWLEINKSWVPTCEKEMKKARWRMTEVQTGKTRKPKATDLSTESTCPQPKPLFMPASPWELSYWQGSRRAGSG